MANGHQEIMARNFILGTDWGSDCDDCVAVRVISRMVKEGKANLLGIGINCVKEHAYASLKSFLSLEGIDALLSTVQMPSGIPVATVAVDGAVNAALLAIQILAVSDAELAAKLDAKRASDAQAVLKKDAALQAELNK